MKSSHSIRWLFLPLLVFAVSGRLSPAVALPCEDMAAYQPAVVTGAAAGGHLSVAVVIHIMEQPDQPCEVRKAWTADQVALVFGPDTQDSRSGNSVWASTRVRFVLRGVAIHPFAPAAGMVAAGQRIKVPQSGPRGDAAFEAAFADLVAQFHRDHAVNVYLWRRIDGRPVGFGRSTRTGLGKATVWLDTECGQESLLVCARYVAHELGHALGLYHAGPGTCGAVDAEFQSLCESLAASCPGIAKSQRLMTIGASGRKLCPAEVAAAEEMAGNEFR